MISKLGLIFGVVAVCYAGSIVEPRAQGDGATKCELKGVNSNAICISKTEFRFPFQGASDIPFSCDPGEVCVDHVKICLSELIADPACRNIVEGGEGCKSCVPGNTINEPVCVSPTEFGFCYNSRLDTKKFLCQSPNNFCHTVYDADGALSSICVRQAALADCPAA